MFNNINGFMRGLSKTSRGFNTKNRLILAALFLGLSGAEASAASVRLSGVFSPGTAEAFQRSLTPSIDTVLLDVRGGYLSEGIAIGRIIRSNNLRVVVPEGAVCYSACAEAFLGGTRKRIDGVVAFHVPRVENARSRRQAFQYGLAGGTVTAIYRFEMGYGFGLTKDINQWTSESTMLSFRKVSDMEAYRNENRTATLPVLITYRP